MPKVLKKTGSFGDGVWIMGVFIIWDETYPNHYAGAKTIDDLEIIAYLECIPEGYEILLEKQHRGIIIGGDQKTGIKSNLSEKIPDKPEEITPKKRGRPRKA